MKYIYIYITWITYTGNLFYIVKVGMRLKQENEAPKYHILSKQFLRFWNLCFFPSWSTKDKDPSLSYYFTYIYVCECVCVSFLSKRITLFELESPGIFSLTITTHTLFICSSQHFLIIIMIIIENLNVAKKGKPKKRNRVSSNSNSNECNKNQLYQSKNR